MKHEHSWITVAGSQVLTHKEGNKHLTCKFIQVCECGIYQWKDFINVEDNGDTK